MDETPLSCSSTTSFIAAQNGQMIEVIIRPFSWIGLTTRS